MTSPDAIEHATGIAAAARSQAQRLREATADMVAATKFVAASPTEIVCGVVGAALFTGGGLVAAATWPVIALAVPFAGIVGLGVGVLLARGAQGFRLDRQLRAARIEAAIRKPRLAEIQAAIDTAGSAGAHPAVLERLWQEYGRVLVQAEPIAIPAAPPLPQLPPGAP